jgi:hypothetical protein
MGGLEFHCDHFIERQPRAMAITQTNPANPCWQALKGSAHAPHIEPSVVQVFVSGTILSFSGLF